MNEVLINALVARINAGMMELGQVPIPYKSEVEKRIRGDNLEQE